MRMNIQRYFFNPRISAFTCVLFIIVFMIGLPLHAGQIESYRIFKIIPMDETAIVKVSDGQTRVIKVGDVISEAGKVVEITEGRVVVEKTTDKVKETVIIRLDEGDQNLLRIKKLPPGPSPLLYKPISTYKNSEETGTGMRYGAGFE